MRPVSVLLLSFLAGACASPQVPVGVSAAAPAPEAPPPAAEPRPVTVAARQTAPDPDAELRRLLAETRIAGLRVQDEESLRAVIDLLRLQIGLPLVVSPGAEDAALDAGAVFDLDLRHAISAANVLNLVAELAGPDVGWSVRHGVVFVTTSEQARGELVLMRYDVNLLTMARRDFTPPRIDGIRLLGDAEPEDITGSSESVQRISEDELMDLIRDNVVPETWDGEGVSMSAHGGALFVRHTPAVQRRVAILLASLGA